MLKAMIRIQWKSAWHLVVTFALAALALPIVSVRAGWRETGGVNLPRFLSELQLWSLFYPALAAVASVVIAIAIWASDRRGHHIYALLLPLPRWRYVALRYAAGFVMLLPIVIALWAGALVATASLEVPPGLRIFPTALTLKFGLALVLLFGLAFALASASARTLGVLFRIAGLFLAVHFAVAMLYPKTNLLWTVVTALATWPGPFAPLGGRWMLIDV